MPVENTVIQASTAVRKPLVTRSHCGASNQMLPR